jgi:hypothetical protein
VSSIVDVLPSAFALLAVPGVEDSLGLAKSIGDVRQLAVLLVDGLGHELLPIAAPAAPLVGDVLAGRIGQLSAISSVFPSTTPTNLVSLGTGAAPGEHGILGFHVNIPGSDRVLTHVHWHDDPSVEDWQPVPSLFTRAEIAGVTTAVVGRGAFAGTGLTVAAYGRGAYAAANDGDAVADRVLGELRAGTRLVYGYHADLDTAAHGFGIGTPQWLRAAGGVDRLISRIYAGLPSGAGLIVTADHGGLNAPTDNRVDLGTDARLSAGLRVVAGEPRVRYLHTLEGAAADVRATWTEVMAGRAEVLLREEAVASGVFGRVADRNRLRIGDVVVICTGDTVVLASGHEPPQTAELVGFHGSLTPAELRIPLMILRG